MKSAERSGTSVASTVGAFTVAIVLILMASPAGASGGRGGHGGHGHGGRGGGHPGHASFVVATPSLYSPFAWDWYGYGWGFPGYGYRPQGGLDPVIARAEGLGGFDLDVKPRRAEVWVDGKLVGLVRDFDGYPAFLWLEEGEHTIAISMIGFTTWEQNVSIDAGRVSDMKIALAPAPTD